MSTVNGEIRPIDLRAASEHEYTALNALENALRLEMLPEDPPTPREEDVRRWQSMPDFQREGVWALWDERGERIVARALALVWYAGDNEHLAEFTVGVLPEFRRQGRASGLETVDPGRGPCLKVFPDPPCLCLDISEPETLGGLRSLLPAHLDEDRAVAYGLG